LHAQYITKKENVWQCQGTGEQFSTVVCGTRAGFIIHVPWTNQARLQLLITSYWCCCAR